MTRIASTSDGRGQALGILIADWAARHAAIKRVWLFTEGHSNGSGEIDVGLELQPVGDSEETTAAWLGNCERWRLQLERRTGRGVELEWLDQDEGARKALPAEGRMLVYQRAG